MLVLFFSETALSGIRFNYDAVGRIFRWNRSLVIVSYTCHEILGDVYPKDPKLNQVQSLRIAHAPYAHVTG